MVGEKRKGSLEKKVALNVFLVQTPQLTLPVHKQRNCALKRSQFGSHTESEESFCLFVFLAMENLRVQPTTRPFQPGMVHQNRKNALSGVYSMRLPAF